MISEAKRNNVTDDMITEGIPISLVSMRARDKLLSDGATIKSVSVTPWELELCVLRFSFKSYDYLLLFTHFPSNCGRDHVYQVLLLY